MAKYFSVNDASFVLCQPIDQGLGWVAMVKDDVSQQEIEHSVLLKYTHEIGRKFEYIDLKMFRTKYIGWLCNLKEAVFVGDNGECAVVTLNGIIKDEYVTNSDRNPENIGPIRSATTIGDDVIVVGMQRQVYRRVETSGWIDMMQGIPEPTETTGFECILAISFDEIYAAGWLGEIWMYNGNKWKQIDSPTNRIITSLCLSDKGEVIGCGRNGMIIKGRKDAWEEIENLVCPDDLWSIESYSGRVFASGLRFMYELTDDGLEQLEFYDIQASSFGVLAAGGGLLWSLGEKDLISFDGSKWIRL